MEPSNRFDLDQAIAAWRAELARHPGPAPADLRELEAHLRDGFAELKKKDLSDEEAFLVARHRIGPPKPVAGEFAKRTPRRVWAPRIFWLAFGLLGQYWWIGFCSWFFQMFDSGGWHQNWPFWLYKTEEILFMTLGRYGQFIIAGFWLVHGAPKPIARWFSTRYRVAAASIGATLFIYALPLASSSETRNLFLASLPLSLGDWQVIMQRLTLDMDFYSIFYRYVMPACLFSLMVWLAPGQITTTVKTKPTTAA